MNDDRCPHCSADLRGEQIPEEYRRKGYYGPPDEAPTHYSRRVTVEIPGVYDGGLFYMCPDCGGRWHRWHSGRLHEAARPYVENDAPIGG